MKKLIVLFISVLSLYSCSVLSGGKMEKVVFKSNTVFVNNMEWANYKYDLIGKKHFLTTLSGEDFMSITYLSYNTGDYDSDGDPVKKNYQELNFYNDEIGVFEIASTKKGIIRNMYGMDVLVEGAINWENIKKFKTKYSENISERRFLTK